MQILKMSTLFFVYYATTVTIIMANSGRARFGLEGCDELIPEFIDHINHHASNEGNCDQVGHFPKPGDCTVFFRCVRAKGRILPLLEYCAIGYTFNGESCIRNKNETDCPQFNCTPLNEEKLHLYDDSDKTDGKEMKVIQDITGTQTTQMTISAEHSMAKTENAVPAAQKSEESTENGSEILQKSSLAITFTVGLQVLIR